MKKFFAALLAAVTALSFSGCMMQSSNGMASYNFKEMSMEFIQLSPPKDGDTIVIIDTDYGEIRAALYAQYAPFKVESFIEKANAGVYNDIKIEGISNDVYFLTGGYENKKGAYIGREDNNELIANEYTPELWPFKGALLGFSERTGENDARWFMCNDDKENLTPDAINELLSGVNNRQDEVERSKLNTLFRKFYEVGGVFGLAGEYTIFGQTYLGFDVLEKLTHIPADKYGKATETVMIKTVTISQFKEGDKVDEFPFSHPDGLPESSGTSGTSSDGQSDAGSGVQS